MADSQPDPPLDVLAIGAHPDDVELFAGGAVALMTGLGRRVGLLHLTRGESATRGTPEIRERESETAARILNVTERVIIDLGDGRIENSEAHRRAVVEQIRRFRPRVVMTHHTEERHPDHGRAHELVRDACFFANVGGFDAPGERHEVEELVHFFGHEGRHPPAPDWIVDVSSTFQNKLAAIRAYSTQFLSPEAPRNDPETYISSVEFWDSIEANAKVWGRLIGARHGEAFSFQHPPHAEHAFVRLLTSTSTRKTPEGPG